MLVPRAYGGDELEFPVSARVLVELAVAGGSVGWTAMIGCETAQLFSLLPKSTFERIDQAGPDVICGGAFAPAGTADFGDGGLRARGRWSFASGCQHADWLFGNCVVMENGAPRRGLAPGAPELRCVALPAARFEIADNWRVLGMRGTGSHEGRSAPNARRISSPASRGSWTRAPSSRPPATAPAAAARCARLRRCSAACATRSP
jgi:alkylation response protein AidB-like acyl-CoA dehydrogenase